MGRRAFDGSAREVVNSTWVIDEQVII